MLADLGSIRSALAKSETDRAVTNYFPATPAGSRCEVALDII
jgi:hypothetical protein